MVVFDKNKLIGCSIVGICCYVVFADFIVAIMTALFSLEHLYMYFCNYFIPFCLREMCICYALWLVFKSLTGRQEYQSMKTSSLSKILGCMIIEVFVLYIMGWDAISNYRDLYMAITSVVVEWQSVTVEILFVVLPFVIRSCCYLFLMIRTLRIIIAIISME